MIFWFQKSRLLFGDPSSRHIKSRFKRVAWFLFVNLLQVRNVKTFNVRYFHNKHFIQTLCSCICFSRTSTVWPIGPFACSSSSTLCLHLLNSACDSSNCRHSSNMSSNWFLRTATLELASSQCSLNLSTVKHKEM